MIGFIGYSFVGDEKALNPNTVDIGLINKIILTNGKYDNFKVDNKVLPYNPDKEEWGYNTILLAKFRNSLDAGNVDFSGLSVAKLRLKRRKIEELNNWYTIYEVPYANQNKLVFEFFDSLNEAKQEYEYAIVPVTSDGKEGVYITNTILSEFDGTYICERDVNYKFLYDLEYGTMNQVRKVGKFEPFGSKYPVTVYNAKTNYKEGQIKAKMITDLTMDDGDLELHSKDEIKLREKVLEFLSDGRAKILKNQNGEYLLISVLDDISVEFQNDLQQMLFDVSFKFCQSGDANSKKDLYNNGFIDNYN